MSDENRRTHRAARSSIVVLERDGASVRTRLPIPVGAVDLFAAMLGASAPDRKRPVAQAIVRDEAVVEVACVPRCAIRRRRTFDRRRPVAVRLVTDGPHAYPVGEVVDETRDFDESAAVPSDGVPDPVARRPGTILDLVTQDRRPFGIPHHRFPPRPETTVAGVEADVLRRCAVRLEIAESYGNRSPILLAEYVDGFHVDTVLGPGLVVVGNVLASTYLSRVGHDVEAVLIRSRQAVGEFVADAVGIASDNGRAHVDPAAGVLVDPTFAIVSFDELRRLV